MQDKTIIIKISPRDPIYIHRKKGYIEWNLRTKEFNYMENTKNMVGVDTLLPYVKIIFRDPELYRLSKVTGFDYLKQGHISFHTVCHMGVWKYAVKHFLKNDGHEFNRSKPFWQPDIDVEYIVGHYMKPTCQLCDIDVICLEN